MHKFKFGDALTVRGKTKGIFVKPCGRRLSYVLLKTEARVFTLSNWKLKPVFLGTFTLRKARGGFRYNVVGLNGEAITTSEVLKAKQSATEMHERHYRAYRLIDKTVGKLKKIKR